MNITPIQHRSKLVKGNTIYQLSHQPDMRKLYQNGEVKWSIVVEPLLLLTDPYLAAIDGVVSDWAIDVERLPENGIPRQPTGKSQSEELMFVREQLKNRYTVLLDDVLCSTDTLTTWYLEKEAAEAALNRQTRGDYTTQERIVLSERTVAIAALI